MVLDTWILIGNLAPNQVNAFFLARTSSSTKRPETFLNTMRVETWNQPIKSIDRLGTSCSAVGESWFPFQWNRWIRATSTDPSYPPRKIGLRLVILMVHCIFSFSNWLCRKVPSDLSENVRQLPTAEPDPSAVTDGPSRDLPYQSVG